MRDIWDVLDVLDGLDLRLWRRFQRLVVIVLLGGLLAGAAWATDALEWGINAYVDRQTEAFTDILDQLSEDLLKDITPTTSDGEVGEVSDVAPRG